MPDHDEQAALWNGTAGEAWVEHQALLDRMFEPFERMLVEAVRARAAAQVLDIGCGTGSTTLAIAAVADGATGIDISAPMLAAARARAGQCGSPARFICADAETYVFEPASFDLIVSRFGVMFFDDPVAAFANLRHASRAGAELHAYVWRSPKENPFMTTAWRAAAPLLGDLPAPDPDAPGQFAFADAGRVRAILADSGWKAGDLQPVDVPCSFPRDALKSYVTRLGPLGRVLPDMDEAARNRVLDAVLPAFAPFTHEDEIRYAAACWLITAKAP